MKWNALVRMGLIAGVLFGSSPAWSQAEKVYDVLFEGRVVPSEKMVRAKIVLGDGSEHVRSLRFRIDPERHRAFDGDGVLEFQDDGAALLWTPGGKRATLRYAFAIDHLRDERSYDARATGSWALFRGDNLFPPTRTRTLKGARSDSRFRLIVPEGWSRAVPYPLVENGVYDVSHSHRDFDRPTGWIAVGELGAVRERLGATHLTVAGPQQHGFRRNDILAFLRILLPHLKSAAGRLPPRLLVVGAGDPMWRGGLSGSRSLYLHAERPLISEDGTSPVVHELMHTVLSLSGKDGGDWIVEGLAEYYSLELLRRSGAMGRERFDGALKELARRGRNVKQLEVDDANGAVTARAVIVVRALDLEIRERTQNQLGLDDVLQTLAGKREVINTAEFRARVEQVTGLDFGTFFRREVGKGR